MLILIPFIVIILIIVAIDQIYYSDVKPKDNTPKSHIQKDMNDLGKKKSYIDKYIKK